MARPPKDARAHLERRTREFFAGTAPEWGPVEQAFQELKGDTEETLRAYSRGGARAVVRLLDDPQHALQHVNGVQPRYVGRSALAHYLADVERDEPETWARWLAAAERDIEIAWRRLAAVLERVEAREREGSLDLPERTREITIAEACKITGMTRDEIRRATERGSLRHEGAATVFGACLAMEPGSTRGTVRLVIPWTRDDADPDDDLG